MSWDLQVLSKDLNRAVTKISVHWNSQALHKIIAAVQSVQNELNVYKQGLFLKWKGREYHEIFISEGDEETTWL